MIRAILFDAGHTLMEPIGGRWFPVQGFFEITRAHGHAIADDAALAAALAEGYAFLVDNHEVHTLAEEEAQLDAYYELVLRAVGVTPARGLTAELARAHVREPNFQPYDDVRGVLDRLRAAGVPLALITDAWPSVEVKFRQLGFRDYFDAFVISSQQGCVKPDPRMFAPALETLGVSARESLFIDDGPDLVDGARAQGFHGLVIDRAGKLPPADGVIRQLDELFAYLDG